MNIKDIIAISDLPGLYKVIASRNNGMVVFDYETNQTKFISSRQHQFSLLQSIAIYTNNDTIELSKVFDRINDQLEDNPLPNIKTESKDTLIEYFSDIVPEYDKHRVHLSDIKKIIKWHQFITKYVKEEITEISDPIEESPK